MAPDQRGEVGDVVVADVHAVRPDLAEGLLHVDGVPVHDGIESQAAINAIRLLIFTGCRLGEVMTLKWDYVDLEHSALNLPDSKTGAKTVHIGVPAVEALKQIARLPDNPWVITGTPPRLASSMRKSRSWGEMPSTALSGA